MGKIARRSSIAGITRLFKDKDRKKKGNELDDDGSDNDVGRGRSAKGSVAETRVTAAVAELDRTSSNSEDLKGLSPAAQLVRQHTLKNKAQEDARAQALAMQQHQRNAHEQADEDVPPTWDRGTAKRNGSSNRPPLVTQNGSHLFVEDEDSYSGSDDEDDVTFRGHEQRLSDTLAAVPEHGDDDDDDDELQGEEDLTLRMGSLDFQGSQPSANDYWESPQPWDSVRPNPDLKPQKGILRSESPCFSLGESQLQLEYRCCFVSPGTLSGVFPAQSRCADPNSR